MFFLSIIFQWLFLYNYTRKTLGSPNYLKNKPDNPNIDALILVTTSVI